MKVKVEVEIDTKRIEDLLITGLETTRWLQVPGYNAELPAKILDGKEWCAYDLYSVDDIEDTPDCHYLTKDKCENAIKLMAESNEYSHHFGDFMDENEDAITGDVFLQFAIFGEVIYA